MRSLEAHWYRSSSSWLTNLLAPFSWLFGLLVKLRRFLYRKQYKKVIHFPVPVIVVGNITVGGTGKTPFVIWLAHFLKSQGFTPGIVSRGVGGKKNYAPRYVEKNSNPKQVGDEAVLLALRSDCPVVVCIDRVEAVRELITKTSCDVIISDDGLQHYSLGRDIEIAIIDAERKLGNGKLLPAGPLRESPKRLKEAHFVIFNGSHGMNMQSKDQIKNAYQMELRGTNLINLKDDQLRFPLQHFRNIKVHAVAGIGHPKRFFDSLRKEGLLLIEHIFKDHHLYEETDFQFNDELPIIMTEKDAVKCIRFATERFWSLPVEVQLYKGETC